LHVHRNALQSFKLLEGESKFKFVEDLVKRNLDISKINSIIQTLMQISGKSDAYRIFMIYVSSGRKMDALVNDSKVFDIMISLLVKHGRMDEAERVCIEIYPSKISNTITNI
jgi:pentatricopeptide repeat protein